MAIGSPPPSPASPLSTPETPDHAAPCGVGLMLLSALCFATMVSCLKYAMQGDITVFQAMFFRCIVSSVLLGIIIRHAGHSFAGNNRPVLVARCLAGCVSMGFGFYALSVIPLAEASVLRNTAPLFVAVIGAAWLRETVSRRVFGCILMALMGIILIMKPGLTVLSIGGVAALLSGATSGLAFVCIRRLHATDNAWVIAFYFTSFSAMMSLPFAIYQYTPPTTAELAALLTAGLCGTGGQVAMTFAYRYDFAARLAPYGYASVLLSILIGMVLRTHCDTLKAMTS